MTVETYTTTYRWRNESKAPVELFSADLFRQQVISADENHKM